MKEERIEKEIIKYDSEEHYFVFVEVTKSNNSSQCYRWILFVTVCQSGGSPFYAVIDVCRIPR